MANQSRMHFLGKHFEWLTKCKGVVLCRPRRGLGDHNICADHGLAPEATTCRPLRGLSSYFFSLGILIAVIALLLVCGSTRAMEPKDVLKENVLVPMRDGIKLQTSIFRPPNSTEPMPVLLMKIPYNKNGYEPEARRMAAGGYIAITQDSRGRYGSEGVYSLYWGEGRDGFDMVDWIRQQPWCNGKVATWGPSYMGSVQWLVAANRTPLSAMVPTASAAHFYQNVYRDGAYILVLLKYGIGAALYGEPTSLGGSPKWTEWYFHLPLNGFEELMNYKAPVQREMIEHNTPDGFWKEVDASLDIPYMDIPALHMVGYYDFLCRATVYNFQMMKNKSATLHSRQNQQLIIGPCDHGTGNSKIGDLDFGDVAKFDVPGETLKWFDRYLKGIGADKPIPTVRYFSMGENKWYTATDWPPPEAKNTPFYLHSGGKANTRKGDGKVSLETPGANEPPDGFTADPDNPVPAVPASGKKYQDSFGPWDEQLAQDREDVLVYLTPPLEKPVSFAGTPYAELYVSADTPDADWVVKVLDVHPNGYVHPISTGIRRGSARDSDLVRKPLEPNKVYRINVDIGHCAAQVQPGHRLGVQIQGSHFPIYDRNTNTGEGPTGTKTLVSHEKVYHSAAMPSCVYLPLMEH